MTICKQFSQGYGSYEHALPKSKKHAPLSINALLLSPPTELTAVDRIKRDIDVTAAVYRRYLSLLRKGNGARFESVWDLSGDELSSQRAATEAFEEATRRHNAFAREIEKSAIAISLYDWPPYVGRSAEALLEVALGGGSSSSRLPTKEAFSTSYAAEMLFRYWVQGKLTLMPPLVNLACFCFFNLNWLARRKQVSSGRGDDARHWRVRREEVQGGHGQR